LYDFNFGSLAPYLPQLLAGAMLSLATSAATVAICLPIGLGGALLRTSRHWYARAVMTAYVEVVRNVPVLVIVFLVFFELPEFGIRLDPFQAGVLALSINGVAYMTEIFRGGLAGVPQGQYEAASSLGMRRRQVFAHVVAPQLLRISFPALGNQVVATVLASSILFFIGVQELTSVSNQVGSRTFRYFEVFLITGLLYVAAAQLLNRAWVWAGRQLTAQDARHA
jgi:His/Glu/Gln/Arg/opine family amino acid ABC transporter permease subunit